MTVNYSFTGRANSSDYVPVSTSVTLPAGQTTVTVMLTPIDDSKYEKAESIVLTLTGGAGYTIGALSNATLSILDNDGLNQTSGLVATSTTPTAGIDVLYDAPTNAEWPTDLNSTWAWGDGTSNVTISGATSANHTFVGAGLYSVTVTIVDPVSSATLVENFSVSVGALGSGGGSSGGGGAGGGGGGCGMGSGIGLILALLGFCQLGPLGRRR